MSQKMTKQQVKDTLKTKILGLMASGQDIDQIDNEVERYCIDLFKLSGHLLKEDDILEIYAEIAKGY